MTTINKLLIVGEKFTGKSSIIQVFNLYEQKSDSVTASTANTANAVGTKFNLNSDTPLKGDIPNFGISDCSSVPNSFSKQGPSPNKGVNADFSLKILKINGQKVRVQLWDQGSNMNPQSTFQPLYTRHVSGCIIVANTSNPKSLERAYRWKEYFDKKTKVPDEPSVPATIFINHDHISSIRTPCQILKLGKVEDDDVLSPERASESDLTAKVPEKEQNKESPKWAESQVQQGDKFDVPHENANKQLKMDSLQQPEPIQQEKSFASVKANAELNNGANGPYLGTKSTYNTFVDQVKISNFEKLAQTDSKGFFGVYHVSLGQPDTIIDAFENFLSRIHDEQNKFHRTSTEGSKLFHDDTLRTKKCICKTLIDGFDSQEDDSFLCQNNGHSARKEKSLNDAQHHPHCPMRYKERRASGFFNSSDENSFVLRRLQKRRFDNNRNSYYQLPPNQNSNSCC